MKKSTSLLLAVLAMTALSGCAHQSGPSEHNVRVALSEASREAQLAETKEQALQYYQDVFEDYRHHPDVSLAYAKALRDSGFPAKAIVVLSPHFMKDDVDENIVVEYIKDHLASGQYKAAEGILRTRIAEAIEAQRVAYQAAYEKELKEAKENKEKVVSEPLVRTFFAPETYYHLLGVSLDAQGKFEQAEKEYRTAIKRWEEGDPAVPMNNLALNLANQGKLEEAMKVVSEAFVLAPDKPEIGRNLEMISALYKGNKKS